MAGQLDRDHYKQNFIERVEDLERRLEALERAATTGLFPDAGTQCVLPGGLMLTLVTEDAEVLDAGTAGATEQAWIEVDVGGVGYLRIYAGK